MEDLSHRLGISKSAIYHHVDSKEDLLRIALDRALDGLFEAAGAVHAMDAPAIERLELLLHRSVEVLVDRLPYVTLLLRVRGNTDVERHALERRRQFDRIVAKLVAQAEAEGDIRADIDPAVVAGCSSARSTRSSSGTSAQCATHADLADTVCAVAFEGLRVRD